MRPWVLCERSVLIVAVATAIACGHENTPPTPVPCTYTVTATPSSFGPGGGTGSLSVSTTAACTWTARAEVTWLGITGASSGTGAASTPFSVAANPDSALRRGTLTAAGQTISIDQEGAPVACSYTLSPQSATATKDGGAGSFAITAPGGCTWTASSQASWLSVTSGASGAGNGSIAYNVSRNDQTASRSGTITAGGRTFTVAQDGDAGACQYSVAPVEFTPCMASFVLSSEVSATAGCSWTATSGNPWITVVSGASGSGPGTIRFKTDDNYDAPRRGTVQVRWPTPTAGQNLQVAQAGCLYGVSRDTFSFTASGGTATVDVVQQSEPYTCGGPLQNGCLWSAVANASWVVIASSMPRAGDDRFTFTVQPNSSGAARTTTIAVRDKVITISQGG